MAIIERKIVCPNCMGVMPVRNTTGQPVMEVTCQQCDARLAVRFLALERQPADDQETILDLKPAAHRGYCLKLAGQSYPLAQGMNIIGRMATSSEATVQIMTDSRKMSRMHARIDVLPTSSHQALLSNWHNKNATSVNGQPLDEGGTVTLKPGDRVMMGDVELVFDAC